MRACGGPGAVAPISTGPTFCRRGSAGLGGIRRMGPEIGGAHVHENRLRIVDGTLHILGDRAKSGVPPGGGGALRRAWARQDDAGAQDAASPPAPTAALRQRAQDASATRFQVAKQAELQQVAPQAQRHGRRAGDPASGTSRRPSPTPRRPCPRACAARSTIRRGCGSACRACHQGAGRHGRRRAGRWSGSARRTAGARASAGSAATSRPQRRQLAP